MHSNPGFRCRGHFGTVVRDPVQLRTGQTCDSETTRRVCLLNIKKFEEWAKARFGLHIWEIPDRWREAKYADAAEKERLLDEIEEALKTHFAHLKDKGVHTLLLD